MSPEDEVNFYLNMARDVTVFSAYPVALSQHTTSCFFTLLSLCLLLLARETYRKWWY